MLKVIETFSGIGSQAQALKNLNIKHNVVATVEWEIGALYSYDIMHNGKQDLSKYRHHTRESIVEILSNFTLSSDGKNPISNRALSSMNMLQLRSILCAIERSNNLVDITKVHAKSLPDADLLTYSFPCQDLSISGHWHNNEGGIDRDANNRSTLLWEIERLLIEYDNLNKQKPKFLLMENVNNILSNKHISNFNEFKEFLYKLGYYNQIYTLDARNFGVPQSRKRTYMISILIDNQSQEHILDKYFYENNLENVMYEMKSLGEYLRLDYDNPVYRNEAIASTPALTPSREKILNENKTLATDRVIERGAYARTVTTKQDRNPNSGIIKYDDEKLTEINKKYRNLTPRECFLLMGFDESQYDELINNSLNLSNNRKFIQPARLIKMAGNSIVVQVLEAIFKQIIEIDNLIYKNANIMEEEHTII